MKKICSSCKQSKSLKYFGHNKKNKFGIDNRCKICNAIRSRNYYWKYKIKILKRQLAYLKKHGEKDRARYQTDIKVKIRSKTRSAIYSGKLKRKPCEDCGNPKSEAHHADYSKPFDVKWKCSKCHGLEHRKY